MSKKRKPTTSEWARIYLLDREHVFRREHHYEFRQTHYQRIEDPILQRKVSEFIANQYPEVASASLVRNVVETIAQITAIPSEPLEPFVIGPGTSINVIVFENGTFNLDNYIQEQLNAPKLLSAAT